MVGPCKSSQQDGLLVLLTHKLLETLKPLLYSLIRQCMHLTQLMSCSKLSRFFCNSKLGNACIMMHTELMSFLKLPNFGCSKTWQCIHHTGLMGCCKEAAFQSNLYTCAVPERVCSGSQLLAVNEAPSKHSYSEARQRRYAALRTWGNDDEVSWMLDKFDVGDHVLVQHLRRHQELLHQVGSICTQQLSGGKSTKQTLSHNTHT